MTQEAEETKPAATKATAKKTPRPKALTLQQKFIKLREASSTSLQRSATCTGCLLRP